MRLAGVAVATGGALVLGWLLRREHRGARRGARAELLARMAGELNRGADLDSVIRTGLSSAARLLRADDGALFLTTEDGRKLRGIAEVHPGHRTGALVPLERLPSAVEAFERREAIFLPRAAAREEDAAWLERLRSTGAIVAPLLCDGRRLGVVYVNQRGLAAVSGEELAFANAIAAQFALAISRAQAFETERLAWAEAESARIDAQALADELGTLQAVTAALSSAVTMRDVAYVLFANALEQRGASAVGILWMARPGQLELVFGQNVSEEEFRELDEAARRGERLPVRDAILSRQPVWLESPEEIRERYPVLEALRAKRGDAAAAVIPLVVGEWCPGVIGFTFDQPRRFHEEERAFLVAVAQLSAQAFERARLYEAERAERERTAAAEEEARRIATVQEQLMGVVGHDLRTPLSAIGLAANILAGTGLSPEQAELVGRIRRNSRRATHLIRDLLDFSRARRGLALPVQRRRIRVAEVCERTVVEDREVFAGAPIVFTAEGDTTLEADPDRIAQVISNLLGNAVRHGAGADVRVSVAGRRDEVVVEVSNHGPPIPTAVLPHIFEPFRRGGAESGAAHGVGLGLFIVRELVAAHGGSVEVSSEPGETTFRVRLPRPRDASGEAAAAVAAAPGGTDAGG